MTGAEERGDVTVDASMAAMLDALDVDDGAAAELVTPSNGVATNTAPPSIVERVLYEAGLDREARPVLVCAACHLPDPRRHDYDLLLAEVQRKLDAFVESDYVVVLFTAGNREAHRPTWRWMFRTYRVLGRKYKKHLKSLIVVHPSPMARLVLGVLRVAVSPKFVRQKVTQLRSLEELAAVMPLEQLRVPDAVLAHDRSIQESGKTAVHGATTSQSPVQVPARAFGVPLVDLMGANGERGVPRFVCECVEYVRMNGLTTEGLFRRSPSSAQLKMVKKHFEEGSDTRPDWGNYDMPVHIACVLIKMVFRELPQPVFPAAVYERLERIHAEAADSARQSAIAALICDCLDVPTCLFLAYILQLMVDVARAADVTRMTAANLAVVLAPNLLRSDDPVRDLMVGPAAACVVRSWITHWDDFYKQRFAPNNIARQSQ